MKISISFAAVIISLLFPTISPLALTPLSLSVIPQKTVYTLKLGAAAVSAASMARYHYNLEMKPPEETWKGSQAEIRSKWAKHVFDNEEWLYAIQTLRNAITSNTFYASTVLSLFALGAGRAFQAVQTMRTVHDPKSHFMRGSFESLQGYRVATLLLLLLGSAYKFAQAARTMTHAGFMFPTAPLPLLQKMMRKSENSQWGGLRYLYLSMGGVVWVIWGDLPFAVALFLLRRFFIKIDGTLEKVMGVGDYIDGDD